MGLEADEAEHSLELHLPYIVHVMRGQAWTLVPIVVGAISTEAGGWVLGCAQRACTLVWGLPGGLQRTRVGAGVHACCVHAWLGAPQGAARRGEHCGKAGALPLACPPTSCHRSAHWPPAPPKARPAS